MNIINYKHYNVPPQNIIIYSDNNNISLCLECTHMQLKRKKPQIICLSGKWEKINTKLLYVCCHNMWDPVTLCA